MEKFSSDLRESDNNQSEESQQQDRETLLPHGQSSHTYPTSRRRRPCLLALLVSTSLIASTLVGVWIGSRRPHNLDSTCTRHVQRYSPVVGGVDITYNTQRFNGSLMKENIFRQDASPEVDEAWRSLGTDYRALIVPESEAAASGLRADQVKVNAKYGGGYPANVEGLHHLHCLNLLRQTLYYNYDHYHALGRGAFVNADHILRLHVSHCLDILRQQLMCTLDVGVLGQVWWNPSAPLAYPDFDTRHTCRNFEAIRDWAERHQAPAEVPADYLQPPGEGDRVFEEIP